MFLIITIFIIILILVIFLLLPFLLLSLLLLSWVSLLLLLLSYLYYFLSHHLTIIISIIMIINYYSVIRIYTQIRNTAGCVFYTYYVFLEPCPIFIQFFYFILKLCHLDYSISRLIRLYFLSMKHKELFHCLKILSTQLSINPQRSCQALYTHIRDTYRYVLIIAPLLEIHTGTVVSP